MATLRPIALTFFILCCLIAPCTCTASGNEVQAALGKAEVAAGSAYRSVVEAETAGANVADLLLRLNDSLSMLAKAQVQYRVGNLDQALSLANQCSDSLNGIEAEGGMMREKAISNGSRRILISVSLSASAVAAVLVSCFFGWVLFKRRFLRKVMGMKPEVQARESE